MIKKIILINCYEYLISSFFEKDCDYMKIIHNFVAERCVVYPLCKLLFINIWYELRLFSSD